MRSKRWLQTVRCLLHSWTVPAKCLRTSCRLEFWLVFLEDIFLLGRVWSDRAEQDEVICSAGRIDRTRWGCLQIQKKNFLFEFVFQIRYDHLSDLGWECQKSGVLLLEVLLHFIKSIYSVHSYLHIFKYKTCLWTIRIEKSSYYHIGVLIKKHFWQI